MTHLVIEYHDMKCSRVMEVGLRSLLGLFHWNNLTYNTRTYNKHNVADSITMNLCLNKSLH